MASEREAAALLAAEHGIGLRHLWPDVLESDIELVDLDPEPLAELVHHRGRDQRADDIALQPSLLDQVHHQERHHLQLVDEGAALVDDADPVGVAVIGDAEVEAAFPHPLHRLGHVVGDRFRMHAAKSGVALAVDLLDGRLAARQQSPDVTLAGPVHRFMEDLQAGRLDRAQVEETIQLRGIGRLRVEDLDLAITLGIVEADLADPPAALDFLDFLLEPGGYLRGGGAGVLGFVFKAAEVVRVVAGGDHQPTARLLVEDGVGGHLGRRRGVDDEYLDAVGGQHLGHLAGEEIRGKAGVVPDDGRRVRPADHILRDPLGGNPNRLVGEVVGDDRPPPVRAELDLDGQRYRVPIPPLILAGMYQLAFADRSRRYDSGLSPAAARSYWSISRIISGKVILGRPPGLARALLGSPRRSGTSAGRKYALSTST